MIDPTLTEQLESEKEETASILDDIEPEYPDSDGLGENTEPPVEPADETPADPPAEVKYYYVPNRKYRRRRAAIARRQRREKAKASR